MQKVILTLILWLLISGAAIAQESQPAEELTLKEDEISYLDIQKDIPHISVLEAKKYKTDDGKRMVEVTLENTSGLEIPNIIVSLKMETLIVGVPYEIFIPALGCKEKKTLSYQLLKESDEVTIEMQFLNKSYASTVYLTRVGQELPSINSAQFAQEGTLGSKVNFNINMERLAGEEKNFRLVVLNLPRQLDFSFIDSTTKAQVNQVKFSEQITTQSLNLEIAIPEKLDQEFIDKAIEFYAFVIESSAFASINALHEKYGSNPIELEDINKINGNKVRLELIPKGKGELEVVISNRYQEIKVGEKTTMRVAIYNSGTLSLINVKTEVDLPYEWQAEVKPNLIKEISPGDKEPINITVIPPKDIGIGEYDINVKGVGEVGNEKIESKEKDIIIRIGTKANILGNIILIGILIILVVGIAIASIKISRR